MLLDYIPAAVAACLLYVVGLVLYRIYFHPLARFPGPKLAAATLWYEGYYDLVEDGQYFKKIREMHKKYGPVVRVNPREIHIYDPDYVDELYSKRLDKDEWFSKCFGIPLAVQGTWNHDVHRSRRGAINRFFSKASIASRQDVLQAKVLKLCDRLAPYAKTGEIVQMDAAFNGVTIDIISEFCYGIDYNYLDVPGFDRKFRAMIEDLFGAGGVNRQFPIMLTVMQALPVWLVMKLVPKIAGILRMQELVRVEAKRLLASEKTSKTDYSGDNAAESYYDTEKAGLSQQSTIFGQILASGLPSHEKTEEKLVQEGQSLMAAGSETTSRALYLSFVHLLEHPDVLAQLREELQIVMPTPDSKPALAELERLPYLTGVIKESIRLGGSTATRTSRISPSTQPLQYKDWTFPPGTPVSITLNDVLTNPDIFPDPDTFNPSRWLTTTPTGQLTLNSALDKYFVPFSKGPMNCVGMWLAWAELYLTIAHVHRKFEMELYETEVEDVATARDKFACFAKAGSRGVRARVVGMRS